MSKRTSTTTISSNNVDFDKLIHEARMERGAAMAQLLVDGALWTARAVKSLFAFGTSRRIAASGASTRKLKAS